MRAGATGAAGRAADGAGAGAAAAATAAGRQTPPDATIVGPGAGVLMFRPRLAGSLTVVFLAPRTDTNRMLRTRACGFAESALRRVELQPQVVQLSAHEQRGHAGHECRRVR